MVREVTAPRIPCILACKPVDLTTTLADTCCFWGSSLSRISCILCVCICVWILLCLIRVRLLFHSWSGAKFAISKVRQLFCSLPFEEEKEIVKEVNSEVTGGGVVWVTHTCTRCALPLSKENDQAQLTPLHTFLLAKWSLWYLQCGSVRPDLDWRGLGSDPWSAMQLTGWPWASRYLSAYFASQGCCKRLFGGQHKNIPQ